MKRRGHKLRRRYGRSEEGEREGATRFYLGPYTEYSPAHERAMKEQGRGARGIRIDKKGDRWWISGVAYT